MDENERWFSLPANQALRAFFAYFSSIKDTATTDFAARGNGTEINRLDEARIIDVATMVEGIKIPRNVGAKITGGRPTVWRKLERFDFYNDAVVAVFPGRAERYDLEGTVGVSILPVENTAKDYHLIIIQGAEIKRLEGFLKEAQKEIKGNVKDVYIDFTNGVLAYQVGETDELKKLPLAHTRVNSEKAIGKYNANYLLPFVHEARMRGARSLKLYPTGESNMPLFAVAEFRDGSVLKYAQAPIVAEGDSVVEYFLAHGELPESVGEAEGEIYGAQKKVVNEYEQKLIDRIEKAKAELGEMIPKLKELSRDTNWLPCNDYVNSLSVDYAITSLDRKLRELDELRKRFYWRNSRADECVKKPTPKEALNCAEGVHYRWVKNDLEPIERNIKYLKELLKYPDDLCGKINHAIDDLAKALLRVCKGKIEYSRECTSDPEVDRLIWVLSEITAGNDADVLNEAVRRANELRTKQGYERRWGDARSVKWTFQKLLSEMPPKERNIFGVLFGNEENFLLALEGFVRTAEPEERERVLNTLYDAIRNGKLEELAARFREAAVKAGKNTPPLKIIQDVLGGEFYTSALINFIKEARKAGIEGLPTDVRVAISRAGIADRVAHVYRLDQPQRARFVAMLNWYIEMARKGGEHQGFLQVAPGALVWVNNNYGTAVKVAVPTYTKETVDLPLDEEWPELVHTKSGDGELKRLIENGNIYILTDAKDVMVGLVWADVTSTYLAVAREPGAVVSFENPDWNYMSFMTLDEGTVKGMLKPCRYRPSYIISTEFRKVVAVERLKSSVKTLTWDVENIGAGRKEDLYTTSLPPLFCDVARYWLTDGTHVYSKGWFNEAYAARISTLGGLDNTVVVRFSPWLPDEDIAREVFGLKEKPAQEETPWWQKDVENAERILASLDRIEDLTPSIKRRKKVLIKRIKSYIRLIKEGKIDPFRSDEMLSSFEHEARRIGELYRYERAKMAAEAVAEEQKEVPPVEEEPTAKEQPAEEEAPTAQPEPCTVDKEAVLWQVYEAEFRLKGLKAKRPEWLRELAEKVCREEMTLGQAIAETLRRAKVDIANEIYNRVVGKQTEEVIDLEKPPEENVLEEVEVPVEEHGKVEEEPLEEVVEIEEGLVNAKVAEVYDRLLRSLDRRLQKYNLVLEGVLPSIEPKIRALAEKVARGELSFDAALIDATRMARMSYRPRGEENAPKVELLGVKEQKGTTASEVLEKRRNRPVKHPKRREEVPSEERLVTPSKPVKPLLPDDPEALAKLVWYGVESWAEMEHVRVNLPKATKKLQELERRAVATMDRRRVRVILLNILVNKLGWQFAQRGVRAVIDNLSWVKAWFYNAVRNPCLEQAIEGACICDDGLEMWYEPERGNCDGRKHSVFLGLVYSAVEMLVREVGGDTSSLPEEEMEVARLSVDGIMRECGGGGR